jgi:hypothetical protein
LLFQLGATRRRRRQAGYLVGLARASGGVASSAW